MIRSIFHPALVVLAVGFLACASDNGPRANSASSGSGGASSASGTGGTGGASSSSGSGGSGGSAGSGGSSPLFAKGASYVVGTDTAPPIWITSGDLDGDGAIDLVTPNALIDSSYTILRGKGDGTFGPPDTQPVDFMMIDSATIGDLDGDTKADIAISRLQSTAVLQNLGDGTFPSFSMATTYNTVGQGMHLVVRDVNGDGRGDLLVPNQSGSGVHVLLGKNDGTLAPAVTYPAGAAPAAVETGDFDKNGTVDLAVANYADVSILLGNGDGTFGAAKGYPAGKSPRAVAVGDLDGDGDEDVVAANAESNDMSVLLGNGDGTFAAPLSLPSGGAPMAIGIADFNGDGKSDVVVENFTSSDLAVFLGKGDGAFEPLVKYPLGKSPNGLVIGDFDKNGRPDIAVADNQDRDVLVLLNAVP